MNHYLVAEIKAVVIIPDEYLDYIFQARGSVGIQGVFLVDMITRRDFTKKTDPDCHYTVQFLTYHQIALICKAVEFPATEIARIIRTEFLNILDGINVARNHNLHINHQLNPEDGISKD